MTEASNSKPSALIAEGDEPTRVALQQMFTRVGWEVDVVSDYRQITDCINRHQYDIVVTELPVELGLDMALLNMVRQKNPDAGLLVLAPQLGRTFDASKLLDKAIAVLPRPVHTHGFAQAVSTVMNTGRPITDAAKSGGYCTSDVRHYEFKTSDMANMKFPLPIIKDLEVWGIISDKLKLQLDLAFQEALHNSIDHGNLELESAWREVCNTEGIDKYSAIRAERMLDPAFCNRTIRISSEYADNLLKVSIVDQGKGFVPRKKEMVENDLTPSGRGIPLLFQIMDSVTYSQGGREVVLTKKIRT